MLSAEGKLLLQYTHRLLRLSSEAEAALHDDAPRGPLALGALESVAATRPPPILARHVRSPARGGDGHVVARRLRIQRDHE